MASNRIVDDDFYEGGSPVADPDAFRRRARQCTLLARTVKSGELKEALLGIAQAWMTLAAQADAYEALEIDATASASDGLATFTH
jgi:hypothetical protein